MAANVMIEVLKQLQRDITDQKDYMRNLHVIHRNINEKFNIMSEKMTELDSKVDKQQLTLERLEQLVLKNNELLFGNDQAGISMSDLAVLANKTGLDKMADLVDQPNQSAEIEETNQNSSIVEGECNYNNDNIDNKKNDGIHADKDEEVISNEVIEIIDKTEAYKQKIFQISPHSSTEEIATLAADLKQIMYDVRELKDFFIKETTKMKSSEDSETADKIKIDKETPISNEETASISPNKVFTEQISQLESDIKQIKLEISEIRDFLKEVTTRRNEEDKEAVKSASSTREQEIVQISPTYFSANQISLLNAALKETIEKYQSASVLPVIEVVPGPAEDHHIIKELCDGVPYWNRKNRQQFYFRLGVGGFQRSVVQDLITDYPHLLVRDVIEHVLRSQNEWQDFIDNHRCMYLSI